MKYKLKMKFFKMHMFAKCPYSNNDVLQNDSRGDLEVND